MRDVALKATSHLRFSKRTQSLEQKSICGRSESCSTKCALPINPLSFLITDMVSHCSMTYLFVLGSGPIPFRDRDWRKCNKHVQDLIK